MKCVQCGTDNNLSDRTRNFGRCKQCSHEFAFEPAEVKDRRFKFTDPFFAKAIADISNNNTLFFTRQQFLYFLDKRLKSSASYSVQSWLFFYIFFGIWTTGFIGGILYAVIGDSSFSIALSIFNIIFIWRFFSKSNITTLGSQVRRANAKNLQILGGIILAGGFFLSTVIFKSFSLFVISVILGIFSIYLGTVQRMRQIHMSDNFLVEQYEFQKWLTRWEQVGNPISKMLPSPREEIAPASISSDISAYSFDRAVICDNAAIAQMLIANNFHFENNCAVLSITGYPQSIFATVMEMLRRNPDLKVYAIHDASPRGVSLVHQLRNHSSWFQDSQVMIYDLGLLPRQVLSGRNIFIRSSEDSAQQARQLHPEVRQSLATNELAWLEAGNFVELESFTPQRIVQVLNQGINQSQVSSSTDTLLLADDTSTGFVYVADSFG